METDYRKKYLKYKKKYLIAKQNIQSGGFSNLYINIKDEEFVLQNKSYWENNILRSKNIFAAVIANSKKNLVQNLEKLATLTDITGEINISFLDQFYRSLYVDINNELEMVTQKNGFNFREPDNVNYRIKQTISAGTGGGDIFLLEKKDGIDNTYPNEIVLKIFNDTIDINKLSEYFSLDIIHIGPERSSIVQTQTNYIYLNDKEFDANYNFNNVDKDILCYKTLKDNKFDNNQWILPSVGLGNFENEVIINTMIEYILSQFNINDNYVRYYNFYITKINGAWRGCILMQKMTGSADRLIRRIKEEYISQEFRGKLLDQFVATIIYQMNVILNILKNKYNLFMHTDLKIENVFYHEILFNNGNEVLQNIRDRGHYNNYYILYPNFINDNFGILTSNDKYSYYFYLKNNDTFRLFTFYIADFDKCSISFKKFRFYNNYAKSHPRVGLVVPDPKTLLQSYYTAFKIDRPNMYKIPTFAAGAIETEQLIMRYSMFPFYTVFDLQSLIISLIIHVGTIYLDKLGTDPNSLFIKLIKLYFTEGSYNRVIQTFRKWKWDSDKYYAGDFGKMIQPLKETLGTPSIPLPTINNIDPGTIDVGISNILKLGNLESTIVTNIDTIFLSNENKLILSLPFIPIIIKHSSYWISANITSLTIDIEKTTTKYNNIILPNIKNPEDKCKYEAILSKLQTSTNIAGAENVGYYNVHFNGDVRSVPNEWIVITNRYSMLYPTGSYLFEYDQKISDNFAYRIYDTYQRYFNMKEIIQKICSRQVIALKEFAEEK